MSQLISIFIEPTKAFEELKENPTWVLPFLVVVGATVLFAVLYFLRVDPDWFASHQEAQVLAQRPEMTAKDLEAARAFMPGARTLAYITPAIAGLTMAIVYMIMALYYLLAGKVTGHAVGFKRGLALTAWASMPMVVGVIAGLASLYTGSSQVSFESLQVFNVDPLLVQLQPGDDWFTLARSVNLLSVWVWFLTALGWKTWFRTGWGQAVFVAILPSIVIFGVMAIFALV